MTTAGALSPTKRSRRPIATDSILPFTRMHCASHWLSCGQTRPQIEAKRLLSWIAESAPGRSRTRMWRMKRGMSMVTGQPSMQVGRTHWMQRSASCRASTIR